MFTLVDAPKIERKRQDEKHHSGVDCRFAQHVARFGTEGRFGGTAAKSRAHAAVFGLLRQDDEHDE